MASLKQRGSFSIGMAILSALASHAQTGLTKTNVTHQTFLNFNRACQHLSVLADKGLVYYENPTKSYRITQKGMPHLALSEELADYIAHRRDMISRYEYISNKADFR